MLKGYLVQIHLTKNEDEIKAIENHTFVFPLLGILKSKCDQIDILRDNIVFEEYNVYSSRIFITATTPFYEDLNFFSKHRPDFIGFSCYFFSINTIIDLSYYLKQVLPNCYIILGGPHVTYLSEAERILDQFSHIDFIIRGQGELAFANLLKWILGKTPKLEKIKSLSYRKNGKIIHNNNEIIPLDILPSYTTDRYLTSKNKSSTFFLYTSLGCINKCGYCSYSINKSKILCISIDRAIRDLKNIFQRYPLSLVCYGDAFLFGGNNNKVKKFLKEVIKLRKETNCYNSILEGNLCYINADDELIELCKIAYFYPLPIGLQAYDKRVWQDMGRSLKQFDQLLCYAKKLKDHEHILRFDIILGLPTQTRDNFVKCLIQLIEDFEPDGVNINLLQIYSGTRYHRDKNAENYRINERNGIVISTKDMSFNDIRYLLKVIWGLRVGYEMHKKTFILYKKLANETTYEALCNIADYVSGIMNYEKCLAPDDFYSDYSNSIKFHNYFKEFLTYKFNQTDYKLSKVILRTLLAISNYDFLTVVSKCFDIGGLFETMNNKKIKIDNKGMFIRGKGYLLLESDFDILAVYKSLLKLFVNVNKYFSIHKYKQSSNYYVFYGGNQIKINNNEYNTLNLIRNRLLFYKNGKIFDDKNNQIDQIDFISLKKFVNFKLIEIIDSNHQEAINYDDLKTRYYV